MRTTSGRSAATTRIAESRSLASPTTSMPSCPPTSARRPARTTGWSSTRTTRTPAEPLSVTAGLRAEREADGDGRAFSERALDVGAAAELTGPPAYAVEPVPAVAAPSWAGESRGVEAAPVVAHV